jgi:Gas vesicle protein
MFASKQEGCSLCADAVAGLARAPPNEATKDAAMGSEIQLGRHQASGLVDVLDRVLDKGLVIAGDIKVSLAEVELLTIRIRLIVCSIDKAQEIGLDWWRYDSHLAPGRTGVQLENDQLRDQVRLLERKVESLTRRTPGARRAAPARTR